jgi:4-amino-4-deoxy-L-arabinose transferase-like glycosyltransferase
MRLLRIECELLCLIAIVAGVYFTRVSCPSLRGEESRHARIAIEMMETGDWVVPRQQSEPYFDRPPLQNWAIALAAHVTGDVGSVAIRLPSVLAVLCTSLLVYAYAHTFLGRLGALAAGVAFATMGQVLELGRLGETEALFTLLVSASLLLWHLGYIRGWPAGAVWITGYGLAALGALTKGPQAPLYFAGSVWLYLLLNKDWRYLLSWWHAAGAAAFVAGLGWWQLAYIREVGWSGACEIWFSEVGMRFADARAARVASHLAGFPLEVLVCMLPWSALLLCYVAPSLRAGLGKERRFVWFLGLCLLVAFPTCWLPLLARPRYLMPLYPAVAVLIGVIVDRAGASMPDAVAAWMWQHFVRVLACGMLICGAGVLAVSFVPTPGTLALAQPPGFALAYALGGVGTAAIMWRSVSRGGGRAHAAQIIAVAFFLGLTYTGVVVNAMVNTSIDTEGAVAQLKRQLPAGYRLVSLGPIHHLFAYYYRAPIPLLAWPDVATVRELAKPGTFFCFERSRDSRVVPDFAWEEVAVISVARSRKRASEMQVVVGRLLGGQPGTSSG